MSKANRAARGGRAAAPAECGETPRVALSSPVALPFGFACAAIGGGRLQSVEWEPSLEELRATVSRKFPEARTGDAEGTPPAEILRAYARGAAVRPEDVLSLPFEWERLGAFSRIALRELAKVPYGARLSYGELAARCGNPRAARAVGSALSRNPWPVIVPCHRVVGAGGDLVGFGKGREAKEALLVFERLNLEGGGDA
jgi:methylated-DNA-[protein]-cysteine S-methyltransferase